MTKLLDTAPDSLATDLAALREDVARLADTMGTLLQHQTQAAGTRVSDAVGDLKDKIVDTAAGAQDRIRTAGSDVAASIERNPVTAMLIAFGIGMSLGMLSRSRH